MDMKRAINVNERSLPRYLGVFVGLALLASSCNFTPGVPLPPPPRQNFELTSSVQDCRGIWIVEVTAIAGTFEVGEFGLFTNVATTEGVVVPSNGDGSIQAFVPAQAGENIAIRRRNVDGEESLPIACLNPPPFGTVCAEPP